MVIALVIANIVINALRDQIVGLVGGAQARAAAKVTVQHLVSRLDLITDARSWCSVWWSP